MANKYSSVDEGYAWVIVFSNFLMQFILFGQLRTFGVLYAELLVIFERSGLETVFLSAAFNSSRTFLSKFQIYMHVHALYRISMCSIMSNPYLC